MKILHLGFESCSQLQHIVITANSWDWVSKCNTMGNSWQDFGREKPAREDIGMRKHHYGSTVEQWRYWGGKRRCTRTLGFIYPSPVRTLIFTTKVWREISPCMRLETFEHVIVSESTHTHGAINDVLEKGEATRTWSTAASILVHTNFVSYTARRGWRLVGVSSLYTHYKLRSNLMRCFQPWVHH
jgi:hypothetical protein